MKKLYLLFFCFLLTSCASLSGFKYISGRKYQNYDRYKDTTFIHAVGQSKNANIYLVKGSSNPFVRFVVTYEGSNWIFFDNLILINKKNERMNWKIQSFNKETEVLDSSKVQESIDIPITDRNEIETLYKLLKGGGVKLRLEGKKYKTYRIKPKPMIELLDYFFTL